jgi:hypothetical protein
LRGFRASVGESGARKSQACGRSQARNPKEK